MESLLLALLHLLETPGSTQVYTLLVLLIIIAALVIWYMSKTTTSSVSLVSMMTSSITEITRKLSSFIDIATQEYANNRKLHDITREDLRSLMHAVNQLAVIVSRVSALCERNESLNKVILNRVEPPEQIHDPLIPLDPNE